MRKFLESLFGTSKGQANMQDIRVSTVSYTHLTLPTKA